MTSHKQDEFDLEGLWNLESIGIKPPETTDETAAFLRHYQDASITLQEKGYNAQLPWKEDHPPLPTNFDITQRRTRSMVHNLAKDPQKLKMYNDVIVEQERRGFIERVACPGVTKGKCHYLPHHAVFKESATTPIRIVYDCSCRQSKCHPSLNDCLLAGPPIANDLTGILLRFRCHKYGFTTDIEKAFLHVSLDEGDRDATRFLWLSDPEDPTRAFHIYRFKVVLFGASSSPFILNATLDKHLKQYNDPVAEDMKKNIYVDDLISGVQHVCMIMYACQDGCNACESSCIFYRAINVLAFKDRHNARNGNLTCYINCWTAKPVISHSFVLNHRLKRCVVRWDSRGLVYLAAPEDSVPLSMLLMMPDIHPNPGPQDGQQENWLVDGVDLTTAHRDSSNGGVDTNLFRSRNDLLSRRRFALKPQAPVLNTLKQLGILRYRGRSRVKNRAADAFFES